MKTVRSIASLLFILTRAFAIGYLLTGVYVSGVLLFRADSTGSSGWFRVLDNGSFQILYPFTEAPFLLGDNTTAFLTMMLSVIFFYGFFMWLLSSVFNTFRRKKLFTAPGVSRLSKFYLLNLIVPVVAVLIVAVLYNEILGDILMLTFLHLIIGIFAYFMAAIFRQGLLLQEEQDLTL